MNTQTIKKELTSVRDLEWDARQQRVVAWTFLVSAIGVALILGFGTFLGNQESPFFFIQLKSILIIVCFH